MYKSVYRSNLEQEYLNRMEAEEALYNEYADAYEYDQEDEFDYLEEDGDGPGLGTALLGAAAIAGGLYGGKKLLARRAARQAAALQNAYLAGRRSKSGKLGRGLIGGGLIGAGASTKYLYSKMSPEEKAAFLAKVKNKLNVGDAETNSTIGTYAYKGARKINQGMDWAGDKIGGAYSKISGLFN